MAPVLVVLVQGLMVRVLLMHLSPRQELLCGGQVVH
jgi:hypothetical protein